MGMSKSKLDGEVASDRFPPFLLYMILYTHPEEKGIERDLMKVNIHGANVPLSFSCIVQQEMSECSHCVCKYNVCLCVCVCGWVGGKESTPHCLNNTSDNMTYLA